MHVLVLLILNEIKFVFVITSTSSSCTFDVLNTLLWNCKRFQIHFGSCKMLNTKHAMPIAGLCNTDTRPGIFRKKSNAAARSRLSISQSSSCPPSPRQGLRLNNSSTSLRQLETTSANASLTSLHRSASTMSANRPRSSPSGFHSYTGMVD